MIENTTPVKHKIRCEKRCTCVGCFNVGSEGRAKTIVSGSHVSPRFLPRCLSVGSVGIFKYNTGDHMRRIVIEKVGTSSPRTAHQTIKDLIILATNDEKPSCPRINGRTIVKRAVISSSGRRVRTSGKIKGIVGTVLRDRIFNIRTLTVLDAKPATIVDDPNV
jgi:hypothetical protein